MLRPGRRPRGEVDPLAMPTTTKVKVSAFVRDTRALAKDSLFGWPKKQKVERKALPRELRDNFDALAKRSPDGSVSPEELIKSLAAYAAAQSKRADKNKDGYLTPAEARRLPKDLQDNYWDYVRMLKGKD